MMPATILTRCELYDLVWSKPLREVASDLGISDVGLAKVCVGGALALPGDAGGECGRCQQ